MSASKGNMEQTPDISVELASVKGQLSALLGSLKRIEDAVSQIISIDKTVSALQLQHQHLDKELKDQAHNTKNMVQQIRAHSDLLDLRVTSLDKEFTDYKSTTGGVILTLKLFSGFAAGIVIAVGGWAYTRLDDSMTMNLDQNHRLTVVERDLNSINEILRRIDKRLENVSQR